MTKHTQKRRQGAWGLTRGKTRTRSRYPRNYKEREFSDADGEASFIAYSSICSRGHCVFSITNERPLCASYRTVVSRTGGRSTMNVWRCQERSSAPLGIRSSDQLWSASLSDLVQNASSNLCRSRIVQNLNDNLPPAGTRTASSAVRKRERRC